MSLLSKMIRIAGRGDDGTAKAIKTDNQGNLKTLNLKPLNSVEDTVALGGALANSLARKPTNTQRHVVVNKEMPPKETVNINETLFETTAHIKIQSIHLVTTGGSNGPEISMLAGGNKPLNTAFHNGLGAVLDVQNKGETTVLNYEHPMFNLNKIEPDIWQLKNKPDGDLEFIDGLTITATNRVANSYLINLVIIYKVLP